MIVYYGQKHLSSPKFELLIRKNLSFNITCIFFLFLFIQLYLKLEIYSNDNQQLTMT